MTKAQFSNMNMGGIKGKGIAQTIKKIMEIIKYFSITAM